MLTEIIFFVYP